MKRLLFILLSLAAISLVGMVSFFSYSYFRNVDSYSKPAQPEPYHPYYPLEAYWKAGPEKVDPNTTITGAELKQMYFLGKVPSDIDRVHITDVYPAGEPSNQKILCEISGKELFRELEHILEFNDKRLRDFGSHGCHGDANIYFLAKSDRSPTYWTFAHGHFFHNELLTPESNDRLLDWFESKGYNQFRVLQDAELKRSKQQNLNGHPVGTRSDFEQ